MKVLYQLSNPTWGQTHLTNYSTNGYPTRPNTTTQPSGDGVISFGGGEGAEAPRHLVLQPYGVGSASNTMLLKVLGWRRTQLNTGGPELWTVTKLAEYTVTLGTGTGVAGAVLTTTSLFATTITTTYGPTFVTSGQGPYSWDSWMQLSPGSNDQGLIIVPSFGFRFLEVNFSTGGVATSCNSLYCKM